MDKDIFVNNRHTTYLKAKSWKHLKLPMNYTHSMKRLITKLFTRQYLKVEKEIKHLS